MKYFKRSAKGNCFLFLRRLINYYKILGLQNYASLAEVKEAYKDKIKRYHPDVSKEPDAEEMAKYLNLAKTALDTESKKNSYDKRLKLAYLQEISRLNKVKSKRKSSKNPYWDSLSRQEKKDRLEEARKIKIKEKYKSSLIQFPLFLRWIGISVFTAWSLQLIYTHFFIQYGSLDYLIALFGYLLLAGIITLAANETYTYFTVKSLDQPISFDFEKRIGVWFVISFFLLVSFINGLNFWRKSYHLSNHSDLTTAKILIKESSARQLVVSYTIDGKEYTRQVKHNITEALLLPSGKTVVRYAKIDPSIFEVIGKKEAKNWQHSIAD